MKRILVIQGGGRPNGNTDRLVKAFAQGVNDAGHEVEIISLVKNEVKGCLGCNACRYGKPCVQKDSFNEIVPKIMAADLLAFASPLYFWTISSRIKAFIERLYCIAEEDNNPPLGRYEQQVSNRRDRSLGCRISIRKQNLRGMNFPLRRANKFGVFRN